MERNLLVNSSGHEIAQQPNYAQIVTKNDTVDNVNNCPVYVGNGGNIAVLLSAMGVNDDPIIFKNVPSGSILPLSIRRVMSTDTTATDMVQIYNIP